MKSADWLAIGGLLLLVLVTVAGLSIYGHLGYNDWTCGFAHCVKVK